MIVKCSEKSAFLNILFLHKVPINRSGPPLSVNRIDFRCVSDHVLEQDDS